ncbi:MAG: hypothetical protein GXP53_09985 [Deltaproteobacteria bacterium]|nr:hypothetical protein [Deltaproteobacteria bacterium]
MTADNKIIIQIYEIQTPDEAEAMIELGVDHVGSVVLPEMGRKNPDLVETMRLVEDSPAKSCLIPLFADSDRISLAIDDCRPDIVHLCDAVTGGPGDWERACGYMISVQATIRERFPGVLIMRTIPIPPEGIKSPVPVMELARYFEPLSDFFLADTVLPVDCGPQSGAQPVNGFVGITGKTCDRNTAKRLVENAAIPVILAGGLHGGNVYSAVKAIGPAGVDSCTLTNEMDLRGMPVRFKKDRSRVARFVSEAGRAAVMAL